MREPSDPIDPATQRRHLEVLRADAAAKAERARNEAQSLAVHAPRRAALERRADDHEQRERNYAAQIRAIDRGEPVAHLRHERALVERELELRKAAATAQSQRSANESLGEIAARNAVREAPELRDRYRDYYPVVGFERRSPQGYDQLWRNERGDHLVVEAKGGAHAKLAPGQMDLDWVESRARRLAASEDPRERAAGQAVVSAMASPDRKVEAVVVAQRSPHGEPELVVLRQDGDKLVDYKQALARRAAKAEIAQAASTRRSDDPPAKARP